MVSKKHLFYKYLKGQCTEAELELFLTYIDNKDKDIINLINETFSLKRDEDSLLASAHHITGKNHKKILRKINGMDNSSYRLIWKRVIGIAATLLLIIWGSYFFINHTSNNDSETAFSESLVYPAKENATLELSDGRSIELSEMTGALVSKDGYLEFENDKVFEDVKNTFVTVSTPKGGNYKVQLPDGSRVFLNADSRLTYFSSFDLNRSVELEGEAYFDVVSDSQKQFVVKSNKMEITVLGTKFNCSAYNEEPVITTLIQGSVSIKNKNNNRQLILNPGEQVVLDGANLLKRQVTTKDVTSWMVGDIHFENESIETLMVKLSRWYGIEVILDSPIDKNLTFSGQISKDMKLKEFLESINEMTDLKFVIKGNQIHVKN